jgi:hypothetical protein
VQLTDEQRRLVQCKARRDDLCARGGHAYRCSCL